MKVVHEWLGDYLGEALPPPEETARLLTAHAFEIDGIVEVDGLTVIDVDVLPNRGSDCLSHRGVARELAAILNVPLENDPLATAEAPPRTDSIAVSIESAKDCPRFYAVLMEGVTVGDSPKWLQKRLAALGQRPINAIVDATNYVMYALGQPLHAYDADRFPNPSGVWQLGVRRARAEETVSLLPEAGATEDRVVTLTGSELLIVDGATDTPIGLAGVKGGRYAGVTEATTRIIIEAAHFDPVVVRKTARRLGIVIDASKRFENEPARDLPVYAQQLITTLISEIAGGTVVGGVDEYPAPLVHESVAVETAQVNALLGLSLSTTEVADLIARTGASVTIAGETITATAPFERTDLTEPVDYIEEVGRLHGLDAIASVAPSIMATPNPNRVYAYQETIRATLLAAGFSEIITSTFVKKGKVQLQNALASDKSYVRPHLWGNLSTALERNIAHKELLGLTAVRIFEIGNVFTKVDGVVRESLSLAIGVRHKANGPTPADTATLEAALASLSEVLGLPCEATMEQGVAELDLDALLKTAPDRLLPPVTKSPLVQYEPPSAFPCVTRDIALWVASDTSAETVMTRLNEAAGPLRVRTTQFDAFEKDGRVSYAFRLVFQSKHKTLTDTEVNSIMDAIYAAVTGEGWEVR